MNNSLLFVLLIFITLYIATPKS